MLPGAFVIEFAVLAGDRHADLHAVAKTGVARLAESGASRRAAAIFPAYGERGGEQRALASRHFPTASAPIGVLAKCPLHWRPAAGNGRPANRPVAVGWARRSHSPEVLAAEPNPSPTRTTPTPAAIGGKILVIGRSVIRNAFRASRDARCTMAQVRQSTHLTRAVAERTLNPTARRPSDAGRPSDLAA